ncbi:MAG: magnesium/cobalt transporter CorA, partial [Candidatus Omnitrophota bacterium]
MTRLIKKISETAGLAPGALVHVGKARTAKTRITIIDYDELQFQEKEAKTIEECFPFKDTPTVTWVNIDGVHELDIIEKIGKQFDLHPLTLEDIVNTGQRPKFEDFEKYVFVVLKMLYQEEGDDGITAEQVSLILGPNYVISFQEKEGDVFDPVRERLRQAKGRVRKMGADYLAYSLLDAVIDNYYKVLERIGDKIEGMEEDLVKNPTSDILRTIHGLKGDVVFLRKSVLPLREVINSLYRGEVALIGEATSIYLRDLYDHTIQVIDNVETFRDMVSGTLDIYLSSLSNRMNEASNRMNEVMKVLTIFAALFIPLTFVAGVYGMNFKFMPELEWRYGYFMILGVMALIGISLLA